MAYKILGAFSIVDCWGECEHKYEVVTEEETLYDAVVTLWDYQRNDPEHNYILLEE